jgi:DNA-directed RNA polymerase subunit RPC12/RpoP
MNKKVIAVVILFTLAGFIWFLSSGKEMIAPTVVDYALKCSHSECGEEFTTKLPMVYKKFPAKCPKCGELSAFIMTRCPSCNAPYALDLKHPLDKCPKCNAGLPH